MTVAEDAPVSVGNLGAVVDAAIRKALDEVAEIRNTYAYFSYYYTKVDTWDYRPSVSVSSSSNITVSDGGGGYGTVVTATLPAGTYELTQASGMTRVTAEEDGHVLTFAERYVTATEVSIVRIA